MPNFNNFISGFDTGSREPHLAVEGEEKDTPLTADQYFFQMRMINAAGRCLGVDLGDADGPGSDDAYFMGWLEQKSEDEYLIRSFGPKEKKGATNGDLLSGLIRRAQNAEYLDDEFTGSDQVSLSSELNTFVSACEEEEVSIDLESMPEPLRRLAESLQSFVKNSKSLH